MQGQEFKTPSARCPTMAFWDRSRVIFKSIRDHGVINLLHVNMIIWEEDPCPPRSCPLRCGGLPQCVAWPA
jgi:hypothetical protein